MVGLRLSFDNKLYQVSYDYKSQQKNENKNESGWHERGQGLLEA